MKKAWASPKPIKGRGPLKSILLKAFGGSASARSNQPNRFQGATSLGGCGQSPRRILIGFIALALLGSGVHWLRGHVKLAWNETESLPQHLFWVRTDLKPNRGDYVLFEPPKSVNSRYAFIKRVAGVAGDEVAVQGHTVFVAGKKIGVAKAVSRKGAPLHTVAPGQIPPGHYFVHTNHRDSYDSRYQSIGLVPNARVIGRATPLF